MEKSINKKNTHNVTSITWIGVFINLFLSLIKFVVGHLGGSQAVIADAVHSLSDLATDFAVLVGVKYWSAPPDECHPYGHHRIETMITAVIGFILGFVAIGIAYKSLFTIKELHFNQTKWIAIIGPALSIILKEILFQWTVMIGKREGSRAVIANAWHHRSDALSSIPAIIAVAIATINPDWIFVDHIGALIVSIFILKVAWEITFPALQELSDKGASVSENLSIEDVVMSVPGVREVHKIRTRKIGASIFVDLHVLVDPDMTVREGHIISEDVKHELIKKGPEILDVVVHLEPVEEETDQGT